MITWNSTCFQPSRCSCRLIPGYKSSSTTPPTLSLLRASYEEANLFSKSRNLHLTRADCTAINDHNPRRIEMCNLSPHFWHQKALKQALCSSSNLLSPISDMKSETIETDSQPIATVLVAICTRTSELHGYSLQPLQISWPGIDISIMHGMATSYVCGMRTSSCFLAQREGIADLATTAHFRNRYFTLSRSHESIPRTKLWQ